MADASTAHKYQGFPPLRNWVHSPADLSSWDSVQEALRVQREASPALLTEAFRIVRRAAAIDTGAIEALYGVDRGFTLTVAMEGAVWQAALATRPEKARSLIQAQIAAYEHLLDLMNGPWPITEAVIRELHRDVCQGQDTYVVETQVGRQEQPLPKGEYKQRTNNVVTLDGTVFEYCPPEETGSAMHSLVEVIHSEDFLQAHPVIQSAWSHYAFILIHPFADGNGRVARLLASLFLCKAASIPFLVFADERETYFRSLREADNGRPIPFIQFVARCTVNAIELAGASLLAARAPSPETSLQRLRAAYFTPSGLSYEELDNRGAAFLKSVQSALTAKIQSLQQSGGLFGSIGSGTAESLPFGSMRPGDRGPKGFAAFSYSVETRPPVVVHATGWLQLEMPREPKMSDAVALVWRRTNPDQRPESVFSARLEEIVDIENPRVRMEVDVMLEMIIRRILDELAAKAERARASI